MTPPRALLVTLMLTHGAMLTVHLPPHQSAKDWVEQVKADKGFWYHDIVFYPFHSITHIEVIDPVKVISKIKPEG